VLVSARQRARTTALLASFVLLAPACGPGEPTGGRAGAEPAVTLEGIVTEQCPATGCWLRMRVTKGDAWVDLGTHGIEDRRPLVGRRIRATGSVETRGGRTWLVAHQIEVLLDTPPQRNDGP